jgi:UDP-N-acetylmuramate: L-alanyl-gamma-D-glutamyl-meso-diaminopimelate ligase
VWQQAGFELDLSLWPFCDSLRKAEIAERRAMMKLSPGTHIHLMGICGTAMASLAGLLKGQGYRVTGSDSNPYPPMSTQLESLGITIQKGYLPENLKVRPDLVIVGNVISRGNPEVEELLRLEIPYTSLPKAMGEFAIAQKESIVIAGTHGKTTTTSMMSWVADVCGFNPAFMIGGIPHNFPNSFRNADSKYFIIEGDEYDTAFFDKVPKFIHYKPRHVVLTSVEFDHADIYKDLDAVKKAFRQLMTLIPENGTLIHWAENANVMEVVGDCKIGKKFSYGFKQGDYRAEILDETQKTQFRVYFHRENLGEFSLQSPGHYNVLNALAVIALGHQEKWDMAKLRQGLDSFRGVKRRQEILGEPRGVLVIEDFAHHPTAVRETLHGIRARYKGRRILSVFEPRSATSRRRVFQKEYATAFADSDVVCLMRPYDQSKIDALDRFSSDELVQDINQSQNGRHSANSGPGRAQAFNTVAEIVQFLAKEAKKGDLILIMSNGGFDGIYGKLLENLQ